MISITVEKIKNGFIKKTSDTNFNGLGNFEEEVEIFELKRTKEDSVRLLTSIAYDLGLNLNDVIIGFIPDEKKLINNTKNSVELKIPKSTTKQIKVIKKEKIQNV